jgi:type IV pilus assembly protein PilV
MLGTHDRYRASSNPAGCSARGFSLLEVMVALCVLCVGLLGILKLEAAAVSSTNIAAKRSLAALEAASLAASMHVNRGYWTNGDASDAVITVQGSTAVATSGAPNLAASLAAAPACTSATIPCAVTDMAAYDLTQWAAAVQSLLQNYTSTVTCGTVSPVRCTIKIDWSENAVAINTQTAAQQAANEAANVNAAFESPSYTLYVEP